MQVERRSRRPSMGEHSEISETTSLASNLRSDTRNKSSMLLSYLYTSPPVNERLAVGMPVLLPGKRRLQMCEELQQLERVIKEKQTQFKI